MAGDRIPARSRFHCKLHVFLAGCFRKQVNPACFIFEYNKPLAIYALGRDTAVGTKYIGGIGKYPFFIHFGYYGHIIKIMQKGVVNLDFSVVAGTQQNRIGLDSGGI